MPNVTYIVLTRAVPGQESAFHEWYDRQHIDDCLRLPQIRAVRRFRIVAGVDSQSNGAPPPFDSLALYEIESDDPFAVARELSALAGSEAMPLTEAFDRSATVKAFAQVAVDRQA